MNHHLLPVFCLLLAACGGAVASLPDEDRDLFNRCWSSMEEPICGESSDSMYLNTCRRRAGNDWAELEPGAPRDEYLLAHGCPVSMVHPAEVNASVTQPTQ